MAHLRPLFNGLIFLIAGVFAGCDDGVSPPDVAGRYALDTVNGDRVPYLWTDGPFTDEWLDAASITLRNDGDFLSIAEWRTSARYADQSSAR